MNDRQRVGALERRPSGQHLVSDHAERPEIGSRVRRFAFRLLGRHVRGRADSAAGVRVNCVEVSPISIFAMPKSSTFTWSARGEHQIRRLEVAMDDAGGVRGGQCIGDLGQDTRGVSDRQRTARQSSRERLSVVVRHGDERLAAGLAHLVDSRDVRVIERARGPRLAQEAGGGFGIAAGGGRQELQRDLASQVEIFGEIDRPHPACSDVAQDSVVRDGCADHLVAIVCDRRPRLAESASTTVRPYGRLATNASCDPGSSSECSNGTTRGFLGESAGADSSGHQGANDSYIFINRMIGPVKAMRRPIADPPATLSRRAWLTSALALMTAGCARDTSKTSRRRRRAAARSRP